MKNENGITLIALVTYVGVMLIVLVVMNSIISTFYNNTENLHSSVEEILEFNKFNIYFLKEIKSYNNSVESINMDNGDKYILFKSGNSFLFDKNKIYYNNKPICNNVKEAKFEFKRTYDENGVEVKDESIIIVTLVFEKFSKTTNYKIENIY